MMNSDILDAAPATFESLQAEHDQNATDLNLDVILDVPVTLSLEVGRARIPIRNLLQLNQGSVVELERGSRRTAGRLRQRHPDRTWRSGGHQRPFRHPPDRRGQPQRADPEAAVIGLLALAAPAATKATQVGAQAPATPSLFGAVFALLLVLALIVGLGWLLKRMPGSGFRNTEGLRIVTSLAVGAKERVVVVEVNGQQLLLGVTAYGITPLHTLPEPLPPTPHGQPARLQATPQFRPAACPEAAQGPVTCSVAGIAGGAASAWC